MQLDFHYYATYCAAYLAGYSHDESMTIAYSAQFVDCCSKTLLYKIGGTPHAATTQLQLELMEAPTNLTGLQDITRIWASFHFLPKDLYAKPKRRVSKRYRRKFRMICGTNSELLVNTVELARGKSLQAVGVAMHVLADTWAHKYFAGTPSLSINNIGSDLYEIVPGSDEEIRISFNHNPTAVDSPDNHSYTNSIYQGDENSIMNLGHGRVGHFPDYSWARYRYMPSWGNFMETVKDNPSDYTHAFCQMIYAMKCLRTEGGKFETYRYDTAAAAPYAHEIREILETRSLDSSEDWCRLGERLSGCEIEPFDIEKYQEEYMNAPADAKESTFLGKFILAALSQKSMVTHSIYNSGNRLAGVSVDYDKKGFRGIKDFRVLIAENAGEMEEEARKITE